MKDESSADRPRSCADESARDTVKRNKDEQEKDPKKPIKKERILKNVLNPSTGYYHVVLCNGNGDKNTYTIHKLVAEAFVEGYSKELIVNHKDENKANNNANNLEWCTYKYNNEYNGKHKKSCKPVIQYDKNMNFINVFESAREASRILKIQYKNISACCRGLRNSCGGYKWKFKEEF